MPQPSQVHVNQPLTNMSLAVIQDASNYVATQMFPVVRVQKEADLYYIYSQADFLRDEAALRAPNTESAGSDYGLTTANYFCKEWAHHKDISERELQNADVPLKPQQDAMKFVTHKLLLKRELQFAASYFTTGVWANQFEGVAAAPGAGQFIQWSDYSNSDPFADIEAMKRSIEDSTGFAPNKMLVGRKVHSALKNHPDVLDRIKYTQKGLITEDLLAGMFELERYMVGRAIYNTSANPLVASYSRTLTETSVLLVHVPETPSIQTAAAGYHFVWTGKPGVNEEGFRFKDYPIQHRNTPHRIEGDVSFDPKVVSTALGVYGYTVVA